MVEALNRDDFKDFEDCLQDECAKGIGADYIITRNIKDFEQSEIPAISPEQFLKIMEKEKKAKTLVDPASQTVDKARGTCLGFFMSKSRKFLERLKDILNSKNSSL